MKLLYDIQTGTVLGRYTEDIVITPSEGNAIIDVPSTIPIPQAIVKVLVPVLAQAQATEEQKDSAEFVIDQALIDNQWRTVKETRNQRLKDSDWTCSVTDYTPPNKADWIAYRQALRDLTQQPNPFEVQWPISPNEPIVVKQDAPVPVVTDNASVPVMSEPVPSDNASVPVVSDPIVSDPVVSDPVVSDTASVPVVSDTASVPAPSDPALSVVSEPIPSATTESATTETSTLSEPAPSSS